MERNNSANPIHARTPPVCVFMHLAGISHIEARHALPSYQMDIRQLPPQHTLTGVSFFHIFRPCSLSLKKARLGRAHALHNLGNGEQVPSGANNPRQLRTLKERSKRRGQLFLYTLEAYTHDGSRVLGQCT